jgi:signal transduction histidine kinase
MLCITSSEKRAFERYAFIIFSVCFATALLTLRSDFFAQGSASILERGFSYYAHAGLTGIAYVTTGVLIWRALQNHAGLKKFELQYLALACGVTALSVSSLNTLGNLTGVRSLNRASILVIVAGYLFMAWALAHHRIFNARQVLANVAHRGVVLACLVFSTWLLSRLLQLAMPETAAWVTSTVICGLGAIWLDDRTRPLLGLDHERALAGLRGEIITAAQGPADAEHLRLSCEAILASHYRTERAALLTLVGGHFSANGIRIARDREGLSALLTLGWITPESLQRRRPTAANQDLAALLSTHRISAAVTIPLGSPDPSLLVTLGPRADDWPVTYPEIQRLQSVAELIDSILTRSRLTDQIALQNRIEHLGMMSRALAHDLKNLITPLNAFLIHTENGLPPESEAARVHASARRSVETISDYVREALFFGENLRPKVEKVELEALLGRVRDNTAARAGSLRINVTAEVVPGISLAGDAVLLERALMNLVYNALDASIPSMTVRIAAMPGRRGRVQLLVADEGSGISPEDRERIFDPYFTTKQYGQEIRGFGLGLTIVQKIAHLHGGSVTVDSTPGKGATFTIDLPCEPPAKSGDSSHRPAQA